jgi:hypothetical protein
MCIDEQITNVIPHWIHVFIQDRGACKHKNSHIVFFTSIFSRNKYLDNHLLTLAVVI